MVSIKFMQRFIAFRLCRMVSIVCIPFILVACGTTGVDTTAKPVAYVPDQTDSASTLEFIPKLKVNKKGQVIPYKATVNPYLKKRGVIGKPSIDAFIQAKRAYKTGEYSQAKTLLNGLLETNPKLSGPWVLLGDVALAEEDLESAKDNFSRAITVNKQNVNAYIRLAKVQRMLGEFTQAKGVYAAVLDIWKDFPEAHLNLGVLYDVYLNDNVKAQKHIEAYQFLTGGRNEEVAAWLLEIQGRTGMTTELNVQQPDVIGKPVS
ncbi:MAG: tetratricopeptide repeat protein [Cellvibrionaceae bacterium]